MTEECNAAYSIEQAITMWAANISVHPLEKMGPERQIMRVVEPAGDAPPFAPTVVCYTDYEEKNVCWYI